MSKIVELAIKKYPRFAERRVGFIDGYQQALTDVREEVEKHIREEDGFNDVDGYRIALKSIRNFIDEQSK